MQLGPRSDGSTEISMLLRPDDGNASRFRGVNRLRKMTFGTPFLLFIGDIKM